MKSEMGNSRRTQYQEATGNEGRGGGNQTAAERVADLLTSDASEGGHSFAFAEKEAAATKARLQWVPAPADYDEAKSGHGVGHGSKVPEAVGGFGFLSVPDPRRNPEAGHTEHENVGDEFLQGPGSLTKDWRTEASRIGRYWKDPNFNLKPYGEWEVKGKPTMG